MWEGERFGWDGSVVKADGALAFEQVRWIWISLGREPVRNFVFVSARMSKGGQHGETNANRRFRTSCWINCWLDRTRLRRFKAGSWSRT